jgi:eukaryotic-like serine/threonine-protein kinase
VDGALKSSESPAPLAPASGPAPRLPPARALRIAESVARALAARGAPHGRLSPDHLLLGPGDSVQLADPAAGEPPAEYLSPEQALGEAIDARADLFTLGVLLYEMLSGRRPFAGKTRGEVVSALLTREPRPLGEAAADLPPTMEALVMRALAKRASERPSPGEMAGALADLADAAAASAPAEPTLVDEAAPEEGRSATVRVSTPPTTADKPTLPSIAPTPTPAAAPAAPPAGTSIPSPGPRPSVHPRYGVAVGVIALALILGWLILRPSHSQLRGGAAPAALIDRLHATMKRGELAAARSQAETMARAYPSDARAFVLLGNILFAQSEKERGLASYREAFHLDAAVGSTPELLANLRATFADPVHGEAAFRLTEEIGAPAQPILSDLAAHTGEARLKRRAAEAMGRIAHGDKNP